MPDPIAIDDSVLQPLAAIRQQQQALREYIARADEARTQVSDAVYRKVADDYRQRLAALQEQAGALDARARAEYQKLLDQYDRLTAPDDEARFTVEELQLRHLAGEIDDEQLAERRRQPDEVLGRCRAQREALDHLKAQFLEALDIGSEAQAAVQPAKETMAPPVLPPAPDSRAGTMAGTIAVDSGAARSDIPVAPSEVRRRDSRTGISPAPTVTASTAERQPIAAPSATRTAAAVMEAPPDADEGTTIVPLGFLAIVEGPGAPADYVLGETTYIGRGEDCHLRIVHPTVSRHHAIVVAGRDGFRIRDLGSQNGTLVNGEPANNRLLVERDEILIGEALLVFSRDRPSRVGP